MQKPRFICKIWPIFILLDPDPQSQFGTGSKTTKWVRMQVDPDPKHWMKAVKGFAPSFVEYSSVPNFVKQRRNLESSFTPIYPLFNSKHNIDEIGHIQKNSCLQYLMPGWNQISNFGLCRHKSKNHFDVDFWQTWWTNNSISILSARLKSSSYLFTSPKRRAYIFNIFLVRKFKSIYKDDIDDVLDYIVKKSDSWFSWNRDCEFRWDRVWVPLPAAPRPPPASSRLSSPVDVAAASLSGIASSLDLLHPLCRDTSLWPLEASTCSCCCCGSPELISCFREPCRLWWLCETGWPDGRPYCRSPFRIFPVFPSRRRCPQTPCFSLASGWLECCWQPPPSLWDSGPSLSRYVASGGPGQPILSAVSAQTAPSRIWFRKSVQFRQEQWPEPVSS